MDGTTLQDLITQREEGTVSGVASICSAHPQVLAATLAFAQSHDGPVLIEATCNQVNQDGGYTGMTPADFHDLVARLAKQENCPMDRVILGGDHLGPNPWRDQPSAIAMGKAEAMIAAYAEAGFTKIHLDCSMSCADDPSPLPEDTIAERAASLARVAEEHAPDGALVYIIGTEVPIPGGATEYVDTLDVTDPDAARLTVEKHRAAFASVGLQDAFKRVIGLVVQPGVEFGHENVVMYDPAAAQNLIAARAELSIVYEAHSTDYQTPAALSALVRDGFAILKVGPWLTFALREALYGLDKIAGELTDQSALQDAMEAIMIADPSHWSGHYHGDAEALRLQRHFSYSDRIRYYWTNEAAEAAVTRLMETLDGVTIPETLISQYLPRAWKAVASGDLAPTPEALIRNQITKVLKLYAGACGSTTP